MCGKAYDPRLIVAWPTARIAVMGGAQAAGVLASIEVARLAKSGEAPDAARTEEIKSAISARYEATTDPVYAAARLWVDAVIDPDDTRHWISTGIACADHAPLETPFNPGVLQT
jgi:acetyl-CoA carboxylase carboxyltransferase component